jgi:hypothetical protein
MSVCLDTDTIRLVPYARGVWGRGFIVDLWLLVERDGASRQLFYGQHCPEESWRGDIVAFIQYFEAESPRRVLVVPQDVATGELMGLVWVEMVQPGYLATLGLCYVKRYRGARARAATQLALQYFWGFDVQLLTGFTPYKPALQHVLALGWKHDATLPGFVRIRGKARDVYVAHQERPCATS